MRVPRAGIPRVPKTSEGWFAEVDVGHVAVLTGYILENVKEENIQTFKLQN